MLALPFMDAATKTFFGPADSVTAWATVGLIIVGAAAFGANFFLLRATSNATRAVMEQTYAQLHVALQPPSAEDVHGKIHFMSGTTPARDVNIWIRRGNQYYQAEPITVVAPNRQVDFRALAKSKPTLIWIRWPFRLMRATGMAWIGLSWQTSGGGSRRAVFEITQWARQEAGD
jgi:hypothetical protein